MKIPKPIRRGETYRITVTYNKKRYSATRDSAKECERWAAIKLLELKAGKSQEEEGAKPAIPLKVLCERYYSEKGSKIKSKNTIRSRLNCMDRVLGTELANMNIYDIKPNDIVKWRNKRLTEVRSGTALVELVMYQSIFTYAQKELFLIDSNVWQSVVKPSKDKPRSQRIIPADQKSLVESSTWDTISTPKKIMHYVCWSMLFALETAMRQGEILAMRRHDIKDGFIHLPKTKNGETRNVPLSKEARRLLELLPAQHEILVPVHVRSFKATWDYIRRKVELQHINFHDTRHEAITRMVKNRKLPVEILAKITGHKTISILINTYYNPDAQDLVDMFNQEES